MVTAGIEWDITALQVSSPPDAPSMKAVFLRSRCVSAVRTQATNSIPQHLYRQARVEPENLHF